MVFCKNVEEYLEELDQIKSDILKNIGLKESQIRASFKDTLHEEKGNKKWREVHKKMEHEIRILYRQEVQKITDFERTQPNRPVFIYKKNRKYHEVKFEYLTGEIHISENPIADLRLLQRNKPHWIIEVFFPNSALDVAICPNCQREFTRFFPHEKYCESCQKSPRSKKAKTTQEQRLCQQCHRPLPNYKNAKAKYCCNACKTAACKKRKNSD